MGIQRKDGPPSSTVKINDLPKDHFPDLPQAVTDRFPETKQWMRTVQERFTILQRRLNDKEREAAIDALDVLDRIEALEEE